MNSFFSSSIFFGITLTLVCYFFAAWIQKKVGSSLLNPLAVSVAMIIVILLVTRIDYETYNQGAVYISDFLTPATVCFAIPLYKQFEVLKKNLAAVFAGILAGCIGHALIVVALGILFAIDHTMILSILPKSVTTAIAMGVTEEVGGLVPVVIIGVIIAGNVGAIFAPSILKLCRITEPVAQGLAIGCCSHALGTSTAANPMGEVQGAMSSLAIVVTGVLTVIIVPIVSMFL